MKSIGVHRVSRISVVGLVLVAVTPLASAQATMESVVATPDLSITFAIGDVAFDGPDCAKVPITWTYSKTGPRPTWIRATLGLEGRQTGADNRIGASLSVDYSAGPTGSPQGSRMEVCPASVDNARGPLNITGTLESSVIGGLQSWSPVTIGSIALIPNPTKLTRPHSKVIRGYLWSTKSYEVKGAATATTITKGVIAAGGILTLQLKKKGRSAWVSGLTTRVDTYGEYKFSLPDAQKYPKGTQYRVVLSGCGWCSDAMAAGKL